MKKTTVPDWIQPVVWSIPVEKLDLQKDKTYIIHQILAYGGIKEWQWLFKIYSRDEIKKIFSNHPYKDYRTERFHFITNYLLHIGDIGLNPAYYVKNTPRDTRPRA